MVRCAAHAVDQAGGMARNKRPQTVIVSYRGMPYELDLVACRRALVQRQVDGDLDSMLQRCISSRLRTSRTGSG
jgi:hypothetical protein